MESVIGKNTSEAAPQQLQSRQIRMIQSVADFQMALSAVELICELDENQLVTRIERRRYRCFEDTAVIAYGRAFTTAHSLPFLSFKQLKV